MFCPNCGAEVIPENAKFCMSCGTSLTLSVGQQAEKDAVNGAEPARVPEETPAQASGTAAADRPMPAASSPAGDATAVAAPEPADEAATPAVPPAPAGETVPVAAPVTAPMPAPQPTMVRPAPAPGPVPPPGAEETPAPQGGEPPASSAPNKILIGGIALAVVAAIALAFVFLGKPAAGPAASSGPSSTTQPEPTPEPEPAPAPTSTSDTTSGATQGTELTAKEMREFFAGKWVAQDSSDERRPAGWFAQAASEGIYFTITFWDDGTGVFRTTEGPSKFEWDADSVTTAAATIDGENMTFSLRSKKLTMTNPKGIELYFVPEDEVDLSNAVDLSQHGFGVTVDPSTIVVGEYLKLIGNESVGYLQIPEKWVNRTSDLKPDEVSSYDSVYYADSTTEFLSPDTGSYSFAMYVQMSRHSASYDDLAQQLIASYEASDDFGPVSSRRLSVGKRRAIAVTSTNLVDNVNVMRFFIDRDNDEKVCVVLAYNCGPIGDDQKIEWVTAYTDSWQVE